MTNLDAINAIKYIGPILSKIKEQHNDLDLKKCIRNSECKTKTLNNHKVFSSFIDDNINIRNYILSNKKKLI
jgi:hypothetical protein